MSSPVALPLLDTEAQRSTARSACSETSFKNRLRPSGAVSAIKPFDRPLRAIIPRNTVPNVGLTGVISDIADYELSKINRDTLPGNEAAVGADLSRPPPIYRP